MTVAIVGIGTWLPERVVGNEAWPERPGAHEEERDRIFNDIAPSTDPLSAAIVARDLAAEASDPFLGAKRRHVADASMTAAEAEAHAAHAALADAGVAAQDVDLVMSSSLVQERISPVTALGVAHRLGANRALAFGVDSACAGALVQIEIARALLESRQANLVLLTQGHLLVRVFAPDHPALPGLGDATSALVLARSESGLVLRSAFSQSHGEFADAVTWVRGWDDATDPPWWKAGGDYRLGSRSPAQAKFLMRETVSYGAATVREVAEREGIDLERIAVLASVQPRGFVPGAIAERLGLPRDRAVTTYDDIAHVGACGPVFNLERARARSLFSPGSFVALYAQGAGFTRAATLLQPTR